MINRIEQPPVQLIKSLTLPEVKEFKLDNGVPVHTINAGEQDVVKIELIFKAGKWYETENLVADFANRMLREGTKNHSAKQLADKFDYYGANINYGAAFETAGASLYSLTNLTDQLLPLFYELFTEPVFPENELATIVSNRKQRLAVDMQKNDFLANRHFVQALYGQSHPYGRVTEPEHLDQLSSANLAAYFKQYYHPGNLNILISGKFDDTLIKQINTLFGSKLWAAQTLTLSPSHSIESSSQFVQHTEKADSVQSAVVLGNLSINKLHPDFLKLSILNTVFGGYFGSRLMSNIREEKGYTYGIHSSLVSYPHSGFLEISTEVGKEVRQATLDEIQAEINLLRTELIDEEELQTVKNYLSGKILRSIDGPLKYADTIKSLITYGQTTDYIHDFLRTIHEVEAEELRDLAVKYLDFDKMYKVTVG
jgi:predicted Zn-dependent peptidase